MKLSPHILILLLFCRSFPIHIKITDVDKDYSIVFQGKAKAKQNFLMISPIQILFNNLTYVENVSEIVSFEGYSSKIKLKNLKHISTVENKDRWRIQLQSLSRPLIEVSLTFSNEKNPDENRQEIEKIIKKNTHPQFEDF